MWLHTLQNCKSMQARVRGDSSEMSESIVEEDDYMDQSTIASMEDSFASMADEVADSFAGSIQSMRSAISSSIAQSYATDIQDVASNISSSTGVQSQGCWWQFEGAGGRGKYAVCKFCKFIKTRMPEISLPFTLEVIQPTGGAPGPDPLRRLPPPPPPPPPWKLAGKCRTMGAEGALSKFCLT